MVCGIAGAFDVEIAFSVIHDLLLHLQHRGQQSVGIVMDNFDTIRGHGLVREIIDDVSNLHGNSGIGHVRYSTVGRENEIQPLIAHTSKGTFALAHNGTIPDAYVRIKRLLSEGAVMSTTIDSELFLHYISKAPYDDALESVLWTLNSIEAAYSIVVLHQEFMLAGRDIYGYRPLFWGKYGKGYVVASEDSALLAIGATDIKELDRGSVIIFKKNSKPEIVKLSNSVPSRFCVFEYIYFARPDSTIDNVNVHHARFEMGRWLYREHPIKADVVVPVLDSGLSGALGFSLESSIPLNLGLMRNRYMGRTFIMPEDRKASVRKKLIPISQVVKGKDIVLIDDSIVRGNTMEIIVLF